MQILPKNDDRYQVYFFTCPANIPFHFAIHPWVVTVEDGKINRWEVIHKQYKKRERFGYVYKNFYKNSTQGIKKHSLSSQYWDSKLLVSISGDENSQAKKLIDFIEKMTPFYEYQENYNIFPGPNSNTYIAWILKQFPEINVRLPWNAFGKNY